MNANPISDPAWFWPSPRWSLRIRDHETERTVSMERPFALLGNHPLCDAQVGGSRGPTVAYVVCAFPDAVEVWPLAAVAFPRWGVIQSHHEILVGTQRVAVEHPATIPGGPPPPNLPELAISTVLEWDHLPRPKVFRRRVTIIGESHPSVMRLHDRGLRTCDHAAIVYQRSLWLLDLNPDRWENSRHAPVNRLDTSGDSALLGEVTIRRHGAVAQQSVTPEVARLPSGIFAPDTASDSHTASIAHTVSTSHGIPAPHTASTLLGVSAPNGATPLRGRLESPGHDGEVDSGAAADLFGAMQFNTAASVHPSMASVPTASGDAESPSKADVAPAAGAPSDQLTARVTQRLVTINQHRFLRRRAPWVFVSAIVFAIAVWLIVRLGRTLFNIWFGGSG